MRDQALDLIQQTMGAQLTRNHYPEGFPALPEVPAGRYTDPRFTALETEHLWSKTWLLAGLESELPQPGSYLLFEQVDQSVIVSRGNNGELRAFQNTCRHRGSALLLEPKGKAMRFVCPYHAWGYSLDGRLVSVPDQEDFACFDKAGHGLLPVRCESWRGMIFINFDDDADPLADFLAPLASQTEGYPLEKLVVKDRIFVEMDCNWKIAYHNFLEIYHVATVHARSIAPFLDSQSFVVALFDHGHSRFATRKRLGNSIFKTGLAVPDEMGNAFNDYTVALPTFPNTFFALDPIGFSLQSFWPLGQGKSVLEARLVGWDSDTEEDRAYWAGMRGTVENILSEDLRLFSSLQRSLRNKIIPKVVMGYQERALYWFEEEVDRRIGVEHIPEALRVTPVLQNQIAQLDGSEALPQPA